MSHVTLRAALAALVLLPAAPVWAGVFDTLEPDTEWTLFHPTPREELRALPAPTSPYTVDPGHVMVDVDVVNAAWAGEGATTDRHVDLFGFTARIGLSRRFDAQVQFAPFRDARTDEGGTEMSSARGIGDTTLRIGLNLWGNEGGATAAGIVPFLRLPTATGGVGTGAIEGGVALPLDVELPVGLHGVIITGVEFADDADGGGGVHPRMTLSAGLTRTLIGPVSAQVQWTTHADAEGTMTYEHDIDATGTVELGENLAINLGACIAMPDTHASFNPHLGVALRR